MTRPWPDLRLTLAIREPVPPCEHPDVEELEAFVRELETGEHPGFYVIPIPLEPTEAPN